MENNLKKEDNFFFMAFRKVLKMNDLTDFQKVLFMEILFICEYGKYKKCIIPNSTFSKYFNRTQITVSKNISELYHKRLILRTENALHYRQIKINKDFLYNYDLDDKSDIVEFKDINSYNNELSPENNDVMKFDNQNDELNTELNTELNVIGNIERKKGDEKNKGFFLHQLVNLIFQTWGNGNLSQLCEYIQSELTSNQIIKELSQKSNLLKSETELSGYFYDRMEKAIESKKIDIRKKSPCPISKFEHIFGNFFQSLLQVRQDNLNEKDRKIIENFACVNDSLGEDDEYTVKGFLIEKTEKLGILEIRSPWQELILEDIAGNILPVHVSSKALAEHEDIIERAQKCESYFEIIGKFKFSGSRIYLTRVSKVKVH